MAIKGKKKGRGGQGARRPASAPRPTVTPRRKTPWWRTRDGLLISGIFLVVAIGVVIWLIVSAQDRAKQFEEEQAVLESYTTSLQGVLQGATTPAGEMIAVTALPEGDDLAQLVEDAETWVTDLQTAQAVIQQQPAPGEVRSIHSLFGESLQLYVSAAQTLALVPDAEGRLQNELFTRATAQRDSAGRVMEGAIGALDQMRREKDLAASGLRSPTQLPPTSPDQEIEVSPAPDDGGGGGGSNGGGRRNGGGDGDAGGG